MLDLVEKWSKAGKDTADMPAIVVHAHFAHSFDIHPKHEERRETYVINWKLSLDDPDDLHVMAPYFPVYAVHPVEYSLKEYELSSANPKFKDWVFPDKDSLEKFLKDKEIYVPGFCIAYRDNWCWSTKKPFGPQKDLSCGYGSSALFVYPRLTKDDTHPDSDPWFGENWLEWYGKRHYIKTPEDVYKVQHELDLDLHLLYIDGDEKTVDN